MPLKTDHGASLWAYEGPCDMWLHTKDSTACTGSNIVMLRLALRGRNVGFCPKVLVAGVMCFAAEKAGRKIALALMISRRAECSLPHRKISGQGIP